VVAQLSRTTLRSLNSATIVPQSALPFSTKQTPVIPSRRVQSIKSLLAAESQYSND
jgi:hypothetical protein